MPTYDYKCKDCEYSFELFQKMSDEPVKVCPSCGGNVKRLIGAGSPPIFKGSGFYITDYKNGSKRSGSTTPSSSTASTPAESKPAAKEKKAEPVKKSA